MRRQTNISALVFVLVSAAMLFALAASDVRAQDTIEDLLAERRKEVDRVAIEALLAAEPSTAKDLIETAEAIARLGDPTTAKQLLQKVLDASPGQAEFAAAVADCMAGLLRGEPPLDVVAALG